MNWWQKITSSFSRKAAEVTMRFAPKWKRWSFPTISFDKLVNEGYKINSAVSACVTTLAFSFPEPPLLAGHDEDGRFVADYKHKMMELIRKPNPDMGEVELMQFAVTYASIGGNCYLWKQRRQNGSVMALWPFSDAQINPIPGESTSDGFVKYYEYDAGDGQKLALPKDDIIQWKWMPDPLNPAKGIGAIELCAREVDKDNEATSYVYALLKNNAVPPVVITLEEDDDPTQEQIDAMGQKWVAKHGAGQPAFISAGMKVEKMGFDLNELAAETLNAVPESRIAANFRIPPVVAGLSVGLKRSDYGDQAARRAFTELTLTALWRSLASEIYNGLKEDFMVKPNFNLAFDLRKVRALLEEETKVWERVTSAFNRGVLTRAEAKQYMGLVPAQGDDVYFVSLASEFIPQGQAVIRDTASSDQSSVNSNQSEDADGDSGKRKKEERGKKSTDQARLLQRVRLDVARRMAQAVDVYFSQLADRVVDRASTKSSTTMETKGHEEKAELPNAGELLNASDRKTLETLVKRFYVEVLELSWNTWNYVLGIEKAFDLTDPMVTKLLEMAATNVKDIHETTMEEIRAALKYGNDNGWSIDQLVRGDENQRGLRSIVDETYKDRAKVIARTELGDAQNAATVERYKEAGVTKVEILDNGSTDDDEECKIANGQIWTLKYFNANRLEHPNCTRAAAPYFGEGDPDRG